jgi:hypothetical protein
MRRIAALAGITALLTAAPALAAPRPATLSDPKGDWAVASQDLVGVRISSVRTATGPGIRAEMTLVAAPDVPTTYTTVIHIAGRCDGWALVAADHGTPLQQARLEYYACPSDTSSAVPVPDDTAPATVEVRGTTVVLTAPYALGLARRQRIEGAVIAASTRFVGVFYPDNSGTWQEVVSGDLGYGRVSYVLS